MLQNASGGGDVIVGQNRRKPRHGFVFNVFCYLVTNIKTLKLCIRFKDSAYAVASHRSVIAEARFQSQVMPCEICRGQSVLVTVFLSDSFDILLSL